MPDISGLVKKTDCDAKLADIEGKIPDISGLATKTALTTVENKIPSVSNLVKKTDLNTKVTEIENKLNNHNYDKHITTPEFNTLAAHVFNARLGQANLITKTDFDTKFRQRDISVDYDATSVDDIKDIHKYLMKKNNMKENVFNRFEDFIKLNKRNPLSCKNI